MTIRSVDLAEIQQTLSAMQSVSSFGTAPPPTAQTVSFATTLAQATSDLSSTSGSSLLVDPLSTGPETAGASTALPASGSSVAELNLVSMLLSIQPGTSTGGVAPVSTLASPTAGSPTARVAGADGVTGQNVVGVASQFIGTPYVWGGTTPHGFDCSGFVQYVYHQLGVDLPRTSGQQATVGTPVSSLANAQPGDLLFFAGSDGTASSPGHVGIYVGNGQMIDAPYTGTTVQVQSLASAGPVVAIRHIVTSSPPGTTR
jgi:cell wall-associated NlpC family hydrolase